MEVRASIQKTGEDARWYARSRVLGLWLFAAFFGVGLVARFRQYLGNPSYWYDEAFLTIDVFRHSSSELIGALPGQTIIPPLFLWLLRGCYRAFGPDEWSLRLPAFVAGITALLLIIPLARRWLRSPGWLWVMGFCALSTHCLQHSVEVRAYSSDFLATILILLFGLAYLRSSAPHDLFRWGSALLVAAALCPWVSFTSVFVLLSFSAAAIVQTCRTPNRHRLAFCVAFTTLLASSAGLVWFIQARHLYYPGLKEHWLGWGGFPKDHSPATVLSWSVNAFIGMCHYATPGLGVPLLFLSAFGLAVHWLKSKPETILLLGPILIAYVASLLGKYPFADRTVFFLVPCIWLSACEGLMVLEHRLPAAGRIAIPVLVIGLMAPGLVAGVERCLAIKPRMEYREALEFVEHHRARSDIVWAWCAELDVTYYDHIFHPKQKPRLKSGLAQAPTISADSSCTLWVVAADGAVGGVRELARRLSMQESRRRQFVGVTVLRYDRAARLARQ
jgi:hypothetical protein